MLEVLTSISVQEFPLENSLLFLTRVLVCSYEDAFNRFAEEINCLAAYQWWEGSVHSILSVLAYPVAWSWQQWRARKKIQRLREYVRSEYDHACLRSCRSRALYEGLKVIYSDHLTNLSEIKLDLLTLT